MKKIPYFLLCVGRVNTTPHLNHKLVIGMEEYGRGGDDPTLLCHLKGT